MTVFKNYFKVAKKWFPMILIYTLIFVGIATITSTSKAQSNQMFEASETNIALINHDQETKLTQAFTQYIKDNAHFVEIEDNEGELRDALFFRKVDYIMIIPHNFTKDFLNDKNVKIKTMEVPDSYSAIYSKTLMNRYFNTAKLYLKAHISQDNMIKHIQNDLQVHSDIEMESGIQNSQINDVASFYNFSNYTLLAIIIVVTSMVMLSFCDDKIMKRNMISKVSYQSFHRQLLLANIIMAYGVWLIYVIASFCLYQEIMLTHHGLLLILNSFVFVIAVLVLSFLLTTLTNNKQIIDGISTVIGLGTSFIAGAFVPQEYLADFVLNISKLTPSYWFISNNNMIAKLSSFSWDNLRPILENMGIVLGFALLFYIFIQGISYLKMKRLKSE